MKKIFLIFFVFFLSFSSAQEAQIECSTFTQTKYKYNGSVFNEQYRKYRFTINDENKTLFIYENGTNFPINGFYKIFDKNEIFIANSDIFKNKTTDIKIDRRSGSIAINTLEENRWWGDILGVSIGDCIKLEDSKF